MRSISVLVPSVSNALDYFFNSFHSSVCGQMTRYYFFSLFYVTDGNQHQSHPIRAGTFTNDPSPTLHSRIPKRASVHRPRRRHRLAKQRNRQAVQIRRKSRRHMFGHLSVATGKILAPMLRETHTSEDFAENGER